MQSRGKATLRQRGSTKQPVEKGGTMTEQISVITGDDLPTKLDELRGDKPKLLYVRGDQACLGMPSVALIGSRACSDYGRGIAREWASEFARMGLVVISGLARGIDGAAHRGALDAEGRTVAVLGCGIDRAYPASHSELASRIEENGAIVSEYEPGVEPAPWRFPARNRIVAALADVTLLIEARERSGSLITCDFALEMERPVFVVPGNIAEGTRGSNILLRSQQAKIATSPADLIGWMESLHLLSEYP
jgi:DNA processing protein